MSTFEATIRTRAVRWPLVLIALSGLVTGLYLGLGPFWNTVLYRLLGLPRDARWADSIHFFFFDTTKILLLLVGIIFVVRVLRSFLSIERTRAHARRQARRGRQRARGRARRRDAVLLLQRRAGVHRLRRRRDPARGHAQLPDRKPAGERGRGRAPLRDVRVRGRRALHRLRAAARDRRGLRARPDAARAPHRADDPRGGRGRPAERRTPRSSRPGRSGSTSGSRK